MSSFNLRSDARFQILLPDPRDDPSGLDIAKIKEWLTFGEEKIFDETRSAIGSDSGNALYWCLQSISRLRAMGAKMIDTHYGDDLDDYLYDPLFPSEHDDIELDDWLNGDELSGYQAYSKGGDDFSSHACSSIRVIALIRRYLARFILEHNIT